MKTFKHLVGWVALALVFAMPGGTFAADFSFDTTFTHQGRLRFDGKPANGLYNFQFKLYTNLLGGNQLGPTTNYTNVPASNGLYRIDLDFGDVFSGGARYIETAVQAATNRTGFQTLAPRQPVNAVPHAMWARRGGTQTWDLMHNGNNYASRNGRVMAASAPTGTSANGNSTATAVFGFPGHPKKLQSIRVMITDKGNGGSIRAEIRRADDFTLRAVVSQPLDLAATPLNQWQTLTLTASGDGLIVQPGEYLEVRASGMDVFAWMMGEATIHDAD